MDNHQIIESLNGTIAAMRETIAAKDVLIASMRGQLQKCQSDQPDDCPIMTKKSRSILLNDNILLDTFRLFKRGRMWIFSTEYLHGLQLICRQWNQLISNNNSTLPLQSVWVFYLDIYPSNHKLGISNWPNSHGCACACVKRHELEANARRLAGHLIFPNMSPNKVMWFSAGGDDDGIHLTIRNQLNKESARQLIQFNRHIRNAYFEVLEIFDSSNWTFNTLLFPMLYPMHFHQILFYQNEPVNLNFLKQFHTSIEGGFITAGNLYLKSDPKDDDSMREMIHFLSSGRLPNVKIIWIDLDENKNTIIDAIIEYFTTAIKDPLGETTICPVIHFGCWIDVWPTRFIKKPDILLEGLIHTFTLKNVHTNEEFKLEMHIHCRDNGKIGSLRLMF